MREALADRAERPDELVASGRQIDMIFKPGQKALSLRAAKLWHLLVKSAGVDLAVAKDHRMALADLYQSGLGHMTLAERVEALRELQTTLVEVRVASPKVIGRMRIVSEALLSRVERDEDDRGELVWRFGETLRTVFANSIIGPCCRREPFWPSKAAMRCGSTRSSRCARGSITRRAKPFRSTNCAAVSACRSESSRHGAICAFSH